MITDVFLIFIIIILIANVYIRQIKCEKSSFEVMKILNASILLLNNLEKRKKIQDLKNSLRLNTELQVILKISNADYLSLFKYDFSTKQKLYFLASLDKNGSIITNTLLDNYIVSNDILKYNGIDGEFTKIEMNEFKSQKIIDIMKYRGLSKVYYQNIADNMHQPNGFIILSYMDKNYELSHGDKFEIQRIMEKVGRLI
jgi:hypothetical protein